jgi:alkanesulfonate monooxygenase SsuD/methylene tetrahydromethanopterin reductase-like flavin-dependent oxidoreductase (luciferase family)
VGRARGGRAEGRGVRKPVHLGRGAGENLNEHVVGGGWPALQVRHDRLGDAAQIIRALFTGTYVNFSGCHFEVERARL